MATDPELEAMSSVLAQLEPLGQDARDRVISWVVDRLGIHSTKPGEKFGTGANAPDKSQDSRAALDGYPTLGDFLAAANPKTDAQRALVVGYWMHKAKGAADFDGYSINRELKDLGHAVSNITQAFSQLKKLKPALAIQLKKGGTSQQARKKYKITDEGMKAVEAMLSKKA